MSAHDQRGLTLVELLVATVVSSFVLLAVFGVYSQGSALNQHLQGAAAIQNNVRLAMDRVERDLRMIGFAVPTGTRLTSTGVLTPWVFHASPTAIGFRAEIDGGNAEIICTPKSTNAACPQNKLRLDSIAYYEAMNCRHQENGTDAMNLLLVTADEKWQKARCSGYSTADDSLSLQAHLPDDTFRGGKSRVLTVEHVYLTYTPGSQPPYGTVARQVRYGNGPENAFPASDLTATVVGRRLIDFWLEYYDEAGLQLTGNPLSAADRAKVQSIVIFMEGYDQTGPNSRPQLLQMRSEIHVRNPES